jgi:hypothetical protein
MAAIEYGSYYWCVLLGGGNGGGGETVHLHADGLSIEAGTLIFKSLGRRAAGTDPTSAQSDSGGGEGKTKEANKEMIYIAFAPGSWKTVYAAKLQDGLPASVEHWKRGLEQVQLSGADGAAGHVTREAI